MGFAVGGDDCYLALRGIRTLSARLAQHQESALVLAKWLQERPEVERVLHPALPDHPGHKLWKRDFWAPAASSAWCSSPPAEERVNAMIDGMELFGLGFSWGGYESLMVPSSLTTARTATTWTRRPGPCASMPGSRIHRT